MGKKIYLGAGLLLLVIAVLGGYYFEKLQKKENPLVQPPVNVGVREIVVRPVDNVRKSVGQLNGQKVVTYHLEGHFEDTLRKSAFWGEGEFVIKGDIRERKIKVYFGMADGNTYFGKYDGNFRGDSTWTPVLTDEVLLLLGRETPVTLVIQYILDSDPQNLQKVAKDEKILDSYIDAMQSGRYDSEIPADFVLVSYKMGIIE